MARLSVRLGPWGGMTRETTATILEETQPATDQANAVQLSNGSDLTGNWSMFSYLFLILSGVLAVMAALWRLPSNARPRQVGGRR